MQTRYSADTHGFTERKCLTPVHFHGLLHSPPRKVLLKDDLVESLHMDEYVKKIYDRSVSEINVLPSESEIETNRRRIGYLNIRFFMQTLLNRMDRTSMFSGLEARVPFADRKLVDYVFNIPWEMKAKVGLVKNILRQASKRTFAG